MTTEHWLKQQQPLVWPDRWTAGIELAGLLSAWRERSADTTVIGLPRGGVAVAAAVATTLHLPLGSWSVRKLALPSQPEVAVGAIASGGEVVWNPTALRHAAVSGSTRQMLIESERRELERRQQLFGDPPGSSLRDRHLIVVDDGIATGMTVLAALQSLRQHRPAELVLAVPVLDQDLVATLQARVDKLVAIQVIDGLQAVGAYYVNFAQLSDNQVLELLQRARANPLQQR